MCRTRERSPATLDEHLAQPPTHLGVAGRQAVEGQRLGVVGEDLYEHPDVTANIEESNGHKGVLFCFNVSVRGLAP